jgi:hypothetical protein
MEETTMNILRRAVHAVLDLEKMRCEKTVKVFRKLGFYRRLFESTGMPTNVAAEFEAQVLAIMEEGVQEQHALACRFVRGEIGFAEFVRAWKTWYADYATWCDRVGLDACRQAA